MGDATISCSANARTECAERQDDFRDCAVEHLRSDGLCVVPSKNESAIQVNRNQRFQSEIGVQQSHHRQRRVHRRGNETRLTIIVFRVRRAGRVIGSRTRNSTDQRLHTQSFSVPEHWKYQRCEQNYQPEGESRTCLDNQTCEHQIKRSYPGKNRFVVATTELCTLLYGHIRAEKSNTSLNPLC